LKFLKRPEDSLMGRYEKRLGRDPSFVATGNYAVCQAAGKQVLFSLDAVRR
jgi:hypothetical protein